MKTIKLNKHPIGKVKIRLIHIVIAILVFLMLWFMKLGAFLVIVPVAWLLYKANVKLRLSPEECVTICGLPGSGKSLFLSKILYDNKDNYHIAVSNTLTSFQYKTFDIEKSDFATYDMPCTLVAYDEASLGFDSRNHGKNFNESALYQMKQHRHINSPYIFANQSNSENDKKIRESLCTSTYHMLDKNRWFCTATKLYRYEYMDELTGQYIVSHREPTLFEIIADDTSWFIVSKRKYGKMYDSNEYEHRKIHPALKSFFPDW